MDGAKAGQTALSTGGEGQRDFAGLNGALGQSGLSRFSRAGGFFEDARSPKRGQRFR